MEESKFSEYIFRVPANELFKKLLNLPEILIYGIHMYGAPETVYSNENEFTIKWPIEGSRNNNINRFKLIEKDLNKKIIYNFEYDESEPEVINQNGRLTLLFEEIAPEEVILKIIVQIYEPNETLKVNLFGVFEQELIFGLDMNHRLGAEPINYYYTFTNPVREVFELLLDLPSLLFATHEKTEDSNENEYTIKVKHYFYDEFYKYKFKIIEKELNKKISYDYDFMESDVNLKGRLTLIFDEINPEKVNLKVYSKHNWLGESLNKKLKIQDIRKIFVKCKGKRFSVQDRSLVILRRGLTLELNNLNITDIEKEVEGLENFNDLTDLSLIGNDIKEITGLDNLKNLINLDLSFNKIEWISGLKNLSNLQRLYLIGNSIREIEGLENLTKLTELYLSDNKISKIRGMENLEKLQRFEIKKNLISEDLINELGGYENPYPLPGPTLDRMRFPQRFVRYCKRPDLEIKREESTRQIEEKNLIIELRNFAEVSQKIRLSMLRNALGLDKRTFDYKIFKWAKEFNFKIDGDFIIIEGDVLEFINSLDNKFKEWEKGSKKI